MRFNRLCIFCFIILFTGVSCSDTDKKPDASVPTEGRQLEYRGTVSFLNSSEDTLTSVEVAIADNNMERSQGLMDVKNLPESHGMLFIFEESAPRSFWMANTPLPLDIMFVNEAYEIVRIHHSTQPFSDKDLESGQPAKYVIETNAGFSINHDIQEGMKVALEPGL